MGSQVQSLEILAGRYATRQFLLHVIHGRHQVRELTGAPGVGTGNVRSIGVAGGARVNQE